MLLLIRTDTVAFHLTFLAPLCKGLSMLHMIMCRLVRPRLKVRVFLPVSDGRTLPPQVFQHEAFIRVLVSCPMRIQWDA